MHRLSTIAFVGMLALAVAGCGSGSEEKSTVTPSTTQVSADKPFDEPPMVNQNSPGTTALAPGLMQPTNATQRLKQVQKGREDPFALLFVQPRKVVLRQPSRPPSPKTVASKAGLRPPIPNSNSSNAGSPFKPGPGNLLPLPIPSSTSKLALPPPITSSTLKPALPPPPLPEPDLARTVAVTGVVQVGSDPQAIVKVPNEATSRYVRIGQRLANGQVLVKRIEINQGSDPVVILEQYGIEVSKAVGEEPDAPAQTPTPATAIPAPPSPSNNDASPTGV